MVFFSIAVSAGLKVAFGNLAIILLRDSTADIDSLIEFL